MGTDGVRVPRRRYALPLTGAYQRDNALTALETLDCLREKGYPLPEERVAEGLASVSMPCRQEAVCREPLVILDGAHNPHGAAALAGTLRLLLPPGAPLTAVLGMLEDKDAGGYLAEVAPLCARIVCCRPDNPRAREAASLAAEAGRFCPDVRAVAAPREALRLARALAGGGSPAHSGILLSGGGCPSVVFAAARKLRRSV